MQVITITSQKGGCGKTTAVINLAAEFAAAGKRVLVIDLDHQNAVAYAVFGDNIPEPPAAKSPLDHIAKTGINGIHVLPSSSRLPEAIRESIDNPLFDLLESIRERYDLVMFDTPSALELISFAALEVSGGAVLVLQCEPIAVRTFHQSLALVKTIQEQIEGMKFLGTLLTMVDAKGLSASIEGYLYKAFSGSVLSPSIPRDDAVVRASYKHIPVRLLNQDSPAAKSFAAAARALMQSFSEVESFGGRSRPQSVLENLNVMASSLKRSEAEISRIREELGHAGKAVEAAEKQRSELEAARQNLLQELNLTREEKQRSEAEIQTLRQNVEEKSKLQETLSSELEETRQQKQRGEVELKVLREDVEIKSKLQQAIAKDRDEVRSRFDRLDEIVTQQRNELKDLRTRTHALEDENRLLKREVESRQEELDRLNGELQEARAETRRIRREQQLAVEAGSSRDNVEAVQLRAEIVRLRAELDRQAKSVSPPAELHALIEDLQRARSSLTEEHFVARERGERIVELEDTVRRMETAQQKAAELLESYNKLLDQRDQQVSGLSHNLETVLNKVEDYKSANSSLESLIRERLGLVEAQNQQINRLTMMVSDLQNRLDKNN
ncbi:MAG: hypothetical protein GMKNLPBB_01862 [Myxococcota bacterium]|nr:hypothetical protein [Myxococcota bacterium]